MDYFKFIGARIRHLREEKGYSLEQLAKLASVKNTTVTKDLIHNIEKARVSTLDPNVLAAITSVFGESLSDFFKLPNEKTKQTLKSDTLAKLTAAFKNKSPKNVDIAINTAIKLMKDLEYTYSKRHTKK